MAGMVLLIGWEIISYVDILMVGALIGFSTWLIEPDDLIFGIIFESIVLIAFAVFLGIF